jgi:hypothetical protein
MPTETQQPPQELWSLGQMSAHLRWSVSRLTEALATLGYRPTLILNDVRHYDVDAYLAMMKIAEQEDRETIAHG